MASGLPRSSSHASDYSPMPVNVKAFEGLFVWKRKTKAIFDKLNKYIEKENIKRRRILDKYGKYTWWSMMSYYWAIFQSTTTDY